MQQSKKVRYIIVLFLLGVSVVALVGWNICVGSVRIPLADIFASIRGEKIENSRILWDIRMPRTLAAMILGGALALAGYLLQTFFHNPIAGPFVLGISSGAKMVVALVMVFLMGQAVKITSWALIAAAFVGAMLCASFVMIVSRKIHSMAMLLVVGMMIGNVCSAATDFFVTFAKESDIANLTSWSMGSFSAVSWGNLRICLAVIAVCLLLCLMLVKPIGAYQFGEHYAASMGVNVRRFRAALIGLSCLLAACVTALVGPISFVGIAVPYMTKKLLGTAKPMAVLPGCFLLGGVFCMACDWIARTAFSPTELAISTVTAFFGAPVVIVMALKRGGGHR